MCWLTVRYREQARSYRGKWCGSDFQDFHLAQHFGNCHHRFAHLRRGDMADAAAAEGLDLGQFAGVEAVTLGLDPFVERLEFVARIFRRVESSDDRRLNRGRQEAA
jgi:hypothetical protein